MLYLHYDPITTALLPYFLGLVYLSIALWIRSELSQRDHLPAVTNSQQLIAPKVEKSLTKVSQPVVARPEQVFQLIDDEPRQPTANKAKSKTIPTRGKSKPRAGKSVLLESVS